MSSRAQTLVLSFFVLAWVSLLLMLVLAPEVTASGCNQRLVTPAS